MGDIFDQVSSQPTGDVFDKVRPDFSQNPPAVPRPKITMQESGLAHALSPSDSVAGTGETNFVAEHPAERPLMLAAATVGAGGAALPEALPVIRPLASSAMKFTAKHPIATMGALEVARHIPGIGPYASKIPSWLPLLAGGAEGAEAPEAVEAGKAAEEMPPAEPPAGKPLAQPAPPRTWKQRLFDLGGVQEETEAQALQDAIDHGDPIGRPLKGVPAGRVTGEPLPTDPKFTEDGEKLAVQFPPAAREPEPEFTAPKSKAELSRRLDTGLREGLGNKPLQPNVPLRQQLKSEVAPEIQEGHTAAESTAVKSYKYDADAKELHVTSKDGTTHVYGEVSPEEAQKFESADSKGKAWKVIRDNHVRTGKVSPQGTRTPSRGASQFRSAAPTDEAPDDLTSALERSVKKVKKDKGQ